MLKAYIIASALGALSTVAFYEGKSALGKGGHHSVIPTAKASTRSGGADDVEDARQSLADSLMRCQERLQQKEGESAQGPTGAGGAGGIALEDPSAEAPPAPAEVEEDYNPTPDEWKELAKQGQVKLSRPCAMGGGWVPGEDELATVGLKANDAPTVAEAYNVARDRAWESTRTTCAEWLGVANDVVERIGPDYCEAILDQQAQNDDGVFRHVAEVRAGVRKEGAQLRPLERYYLAKTREMSALEADLTRRVGAEGARRITQSSAFCVTHEQWPDSSERE